LLRTSTPSSVCGESRPENMCRDNYDEFAVAVSSPKMDSVTVSRASPFRAVIRNLEDQRSRQPFAARLVNDVEGRGLRRHRNRVECDGLHARFRPHECRNRNRASQRSRAIRQARCGFPRSEPEITSGIQVGALRALDKPKGLSPQANNLTCATLCTQQQSLRPRDHLQYNSRGYLMRAITSITTSTRTTITTQANCGRG
jgi:hypothetical protein